MARLFIALEVRANWPEELPHGRLIHEDERHMTLAFLGEKDLKKTVDELKELDISELTIGPTGIFDKCLRLHNTLCWHVDILTQKEPLYNLQQVLTRHFVPDETRDFLPHVTVARKPFDTQQWQSAFTAQPMYGFRIHLYESMGNLTYLPRYTKELLAPFEEKEHTADIAYIVRGHTVTDLYRNAAIALSCTYAPFVQFIERDTHSTLNDVIRSLNKMIALADSAHGAPIKAVSYHGDILEREDNVLEWEMIVDV